MHVPSIGGLHYFLIFKDDCSSYAMISVIHDKMQILKKFKEMQMQVRKYGHQIEIVRRDCGTEILNEALENYLIEQGIKHETSTPYCPEQNGYVERHMRTVTEAALSMIHDAGLAHSFWGKAVSYAVHIQNRIVAKHLNDITPHQAFTGSKPSLSHIRIFGTKAFMYIQKGQRKKWDAKAKEMIFVGYDEDKKSYRLMDPASKRIFFSHDVLVDEGIHGSSDGSDCESEAVVVNDNDHRNEGEQ